MNRRVWIPILLACLVASALVIHFLLPVAPTTYYKVVPLAAAQNVYPNDPAIRGGFRLEIGSASDGFQPVVLDKPGTEVGVIGGGCLVFQTAKDPFECSAQGGKDVGGCDDFMTEKTASAYCDLSSGANGTCWFSPVDAAPPSATTACQKSGPSASLDKNTTYPVSAALLLPAEMAKIRWRVMTCQSMKDKQGCWGEENVDLRLRWGPVLGPSPAPAPP